MQWHFSCLVLTLLLVCPTSANPVPHLRATSKIRGQQAYLNSWQLAVRSTIYALHRYGNGGYSTSDSAKAALRQAFTWDEQRKQPIFHPEIARPSFCSGAVYGVLISALVQWELRQGKRSIPPKAWQAMLVRDNQDGDGVWGWANANGPGFAMLVHRLKAGYSFTNLNQARAADIVKLWWTDELGREERGHLVIFDRDEGDSIRVWSSHRPKNGQPGGYGLRRYPKSSIRRALVTRITNPAAFRHAPSIGFEPWLHNLLNDSTTWNECLRRTGIVQESQ